MKSAALANSTSQVARRRERPNCGRFDDSEGRGNARTTILWLVGEAVVCGAVGCCYISKPVLVEGQ